MSATDDNLKIGKYYQTNIDIKKRYMDDFFQMIRNQLEYGATKYASESQGREATDMLVEAWGEEWLFGTMDKYLKRYKNLHRERDLLKIATYCYIKWLHDGYHLKTEHDEDVFNER